MVDVFYHIDFCSFKEDQILFLIFVTVVSESLESCHVFVALSELLPVWQRKPVIFAIRKLLNEL
jgi:hypothetical protein